MAAASLALVMLLAAPGRAAGHVDPARAGSSSCADLLRFAFPDLCGLRVVQENLTVRGLRLAYWRYSAENTSTPAKGPRKLPILVAHGGPAFGHSYMLPLKQQACRGREVVFYDQVGCGLSSIPAEPHETAPWLFTTDYYVEEAKAVVAALGWTAFHFIGHSWGTVVGQAYGLQHDTRLKGLILAGPISDGQLYIRSQWDQQVGSLGTLPLYTQHVIHKLESLHAYNSPLYAVEDSGLTSFFTTRTIPVPDCFLVSANGVATGVSREIYVGMQGASEFTLGGVLSDLNFTGRLSQIANPVLLIRGKFDTMRAPTVDALFENLQHAWMAVAPRSGHCSMLDDPRLVNDIVGEFLDRVEAGRLGSFQAWIDWAVAASVGALQALAVTDMGANTPAQWAPAFMQGSLLMLAGVAIGVFAGPCLAPRYYARVLWEESAHMDLRTRLSK